MYSLWLQNIKKDKTASCKACSSQIKQIKRTNYLIHTVNSLLTIEDPMMISEDFFFPDFAKSPSTKLYCWTNDFFRLRFNSFSLYGFATDSSWKQPPFYTNGIRTVRNIAHFFSPPAPYTISTVDGSIFCTFEGLTRGRTSFYLSQYMHNLWLLLTKLYITQFSSLTDMFHKI